MRVQEFTKIMKKLESTRGRQFFEEELQHSGWFFLDLTLRQHNTIVSQLLIWYEPVEINKKKYVKIPNGLLLEII